VLAPQQLPVGIGGSDSEAAAAHSPRWSWKATSAVAAGFLAVAGVLTVLRAPVPTPAPLAVENLAAAPPKTASAPAGPLTGDALPETPVIASGEMVRDAGLDRYLSAHKRFSGSSALGVPSNFLRSATVDAAGR
jgi:sigma-E factor negative regulatory protein RseA